MHTYDDDMFFSNLPTEDRMHVFINEYRCSVKELYNDVVLATNMYAGKVY